MRRLNFSLPSASSDAEILLKFFSVSSPDSWNQVWRASNAAYRQTRTDTLKEEWIAAWVRQAEMDAVEPDVAEFDERRLRASMDELRALTRVSASQIIEPVQRICAAAGLAVVWVLELSNTGISGCARWLSDKKALLGLTFRYKTDDQMWFTFFHEVGHILLHRSRRSFVIDNAAEDLSDRVVDPEIQQVEAEANRFSADTLIPPGALTEFIRAGAFTNESIHDFAEAVGIGPGILVGRLQHDHVLRHFQGNDLKQRLNLGFAMEDDTAYFDQSEQ